MWLILALTPARADFFHPRDVAAASTAYSTASERSAELAGDAQRDARRFSTALASFEEALDLLGQAAPADQRARQEGLEKQYNRDFAALQGFADQLVGDFDGAFVAALERALAAHPAAERCERQLAKGPKLPGMAQRTAANPDCKGADLNSALAASMDADPVLETDLDSILGRVWPELVLAPESVAPIGGERTVQVADFYQAAMPEVLKKIRFQDEEARESFAVAIEGGADKEQLSGLVQAAKGVDAKTAAARAAVAGPVHLKAAAALAKRAPDAGWCAQPITLGGCAGTDDSRPLIDLLLADKKVAKAIP